MPRLVATLLVLLASSTQAQLFGDPTFSGPLPPAYHIADPTDRVLWDGISHVDGSGAGLQSRLGLPVITARGTTRTCQRVDGSLTTLNVNQPCVTSGLVTGTTNLLRWSEQIDNAVWTKNASAQVTISTDGALSPIGTQTAERLTWTNVGGIYNLYYLLTVEPGQTYTASIYLRRVSGTDWYRFMFYDGNTNQARVWVNLSTGQMGTSGAAGSATFVGASMAPAGNGWYRVSVSGAIATTTGYVQLTPQTDDNNTNQQGGSVYEVWGAQLEKAASAGRYVRTEVNPQFESDERRQLEVAGSVTNILLRSNELDNAAWSNAGTPTISANTVPAPDGTTSGETLLDDDAVNAEGRSQSVSTTSGQPYTMSCWLRANTLASARLGGSIGSSCVFSNLPSTWQRKSCTWTASATSHTFAVFAGALNSDVGSVDIWGCQVEAGTAVSRYVPTVATAVTSSSDTVQMALPGYTTVLNMAGRSEELETSGTWGGLANVTVNAIAAPDGNLTAELLTKTTSATSENKAQAPFTTVPGTPYTLSVFLRGSATSTTASFGIYCSAWVPGWSARILNGPGTILSGVGLNPATITGLSTTQWTRASYTITAPNNSCGIYLYPDSNTSTTVGNGTYFWGAQLEQAASAGPYVKTTAGTSGATLVPDVLVVSNLLAQSEGLDTASWTRARVSVVPNVLDSPLGLVADKLVEDTSASTTHYTHQSIPLPDNTSYNCSAYAKAGERTSLYAETADKGGTYLGAVFNLSTGTVTSAPANLARSIEPAGNGWYRVSIGFNSGSGGARTTAPCTWALWVGSSSYTGDGTSGLYLTGMQMETGTLTPGPYVKTTTTAASQLMQGSGSPTGLANQYPVNLLQRSEEFDSSAWTVTSTATKGTANAVAAPDGSGTTADEVLQGSIDGAGIEQAFTGDGTQVALSVWARTASGSYTGTLGSGIWNSTTNSWACQPGAGQTVDTTWRRYSCTAVAPAGNVMRAVAWRFPAAATAPQGTVVYIWGAQLESGGTPGPYVKTPAAAPITSGALASGSVTNLALRSEELNLSPWGIAATLTADVATAPDGTQTADLLAKAAVTTSEGRVQNLTLTQGQVYTFSLYVKASPTSDKLDWGVYCGAWSGLATAQVLSGPGTASSPTGTYSRVTGLSQTQWTRVAVTAPTMGTACQLYLYPDTVPSTTIGNGVYLWGMQLEQGWTAGSYVKTGAASASYTYSPLVSDNEGCVRACFRVTDTPTTNAYIVGFGSPGSITGTLRLNGGNNTMLSLSDVSSVANVTLSDIRNRDVCVRGWWSTPLGLKGIESEGLSSSNSYDGSILGPIVYLGSSISLNGKLWNVMLGKSKDGCRLQDIYPTTLLPSDLPYAESSGASFSTNRGTPVVLSRASARTCVSGNQVATALGENQPCVSTNSVTNFARYSEEMDNGLWLTGGTCTVTPNQGMLPGASSPTMELIQCTAITSVRYVPAPALSHAGPFTASAWVAAPSGTVDATVALNMIGGSSATNCSCTRSDGGACTAAPSGTIGYAWANVGTTPVRLSVTCTPSQATVTQVNLLLHDGRYSSTVGTGALFGGAQLEKRPGPGDYLKTQGTAVTASSDIKGLEVAGAVTNILQYSETYGSGSTPQAPWAIAAATLTFTKGHASCNPAPDGSNNATLLACSGTCGFTQDTGVAAGANTTTVSAWMRRPTGQSQTPSISFGDGNGASSSSIVTLGDAWQRYAFPGPRTSSQGISFGYGATWDSTNDGNICLWGAQSVVGNATGARYVPTTTAAATSAGETATLTTPTGFSPTEGCTRVCITPTWSGANPAAISRFFLNGTGGGGNARFAYVAPGTNVVSAYDGIRTASVSHSYLAGVRACFVTDWSAARGFLRVTNLSTGASNQQSGFTSFAAFDASLYVGGLSSGSNTAEARLDDIRLGRNWGDCQ